MERGWLDAYIQDMTKDIATSLDMDELQRCADREPQRDRPALRYGLLVGNALLFVNGERISNACDHARKIAAHRPGSAVTLTILRDGTERDLIGTSPQQVNTAAKSDEAPQLKSIVWYREQAETGNASAMVGNTQGGHHQKLRKSGALVPQGV